MSRMMHFRELNGYQNVLSAVLEVHELTKTFLFEALDQKYDNITGMLARMLNAPEKWIIDAKKGGS